MTVTVVLPERGTDGGGGATTTTTEATWASFNGIDPAQSFLILAGDSKIFLLTQNDGFNARMAQLTAAGGPFEGLQGWVNMGSSGYTLNGFVNDAASDTWVGPSAGDADWNFAGTKTGAYSNTATPLANLLEFVDGLADDIRPIICLGHEFNDLALYAANGNLSATEQVTYLIELLRTAVETIHEARPNALIVLIVPHHMLPRPYTGVIPSSSAYPTFGSNLTNDVAKLTTWNQSFYDAKHQVASEYGYTTVWDWRRVSGEPNLTTDTASTWPYYTDLAHEAYAGANWLADDCVQVLTGDIYSPVIGRARLAEAVADLDSSYPLTNYSRYCELHPEKFSRVVVDSLVGIGSNYMDIGIPYGEWVPAISGATTIYVQIGDAAGQVFTSYGAGASGGNTRLTSITPSAAMQAAAVGLEVSVYVARVQSTGDDYLDALQFNFSSYRKAYACSMSAGSGYIDVSFTAVSGLFRIDALRDLAGLYLAVGGGADTTIDLSSGWSVGNWTPASRFVRLLKSGDQSAYNGKSGLLLVNQSAIDPKEREAPYVVAASNRLSELYAMGYVTGYQPNCTTVTVSTGIAVASGVTVEAFVFSSNLRTSLGSATISANSINATITHASRNWVPNETLELVVTSPGSYSGLARLSGVCG